MSPQSLRQVGALPLGSHVRKGIWPSSVAVAEFTGRQGLPGGGPASDQVGVVDSIAHCSLNHKVQNPHRGDECEQRANTLDECPSDKHCLEVRGQAGSPIEKATRDVTVARRKGPVRLSNLDSTGCRLVRKGLTVAHGGFHYRVARVLRGQCIAELKNAFGGVHHPRIVIPLICETVQVVA